MSAVGRPPKYKSVGEIEEKIEQYFQSCEGKPLLDADGNPMLNKWQKPIVIGEKPPTITGLALALGFCCRRDLLNYQGKKEFCNTITRAKSKVEAYAESRLFDRDGSNGAQFSLRNNFKGWNGEQESQQEELKKLDDIVKSIDRVANGAKGVQSETDRILEQCDPSVEFQNRGNEGGEDLH